MAPIPGEAIDSWLEAVAARTHTAWGDILAAVGLHNDDRKPYPPWTVTLAGTELEHLQTATQTDNSSALTLQRYHGTAVLIDPQTHQLTSTAPWTRRAGSRFCPYCLDDNQGRWQLQWRLGWAFACPIHHCLLADLCPSCLRAARSRAYPSDRTPRPGRCPNPSPLDKGRGRSAPRCDTDLTTAPVMTFSSDHPVIRAQSLINQIIDEASAQFGVYAKSPQPAMKVLGDIRAIAGRVLHFATERDLARRLPDDLLAAAAPDNAPDHAPEGMRSILFTEAFELGARPALDSPANAATTAIAVHTALDVLDREDIGAAGDHLRWLIPARHDLEHHIRPSTVWGGDTTSPVLAAIQIASLAPGMAPSDQLRYRVRSELPGRRSSRSDTGLDIRLVPTEFWPTLGNLLTTPNTRRTNVGLAMSAALHLVGTGATLTDAALRAGGNISGHALSRFLQLMEAESHWPAISTALTRIAEHLAAHGSPIDYHRRRNLDYTALLPDEAWRQISRDTATPSPGPARAAIARGYLQERLSACPAQVTNSYLRGKIGTFPRHLTPQLSDALFEHAHDFLTAAGIDDEPVEWAPPVSLLGDLDLPGTWPGQINTYRLRELIRDHDVNLSTVARELETTIGAVRLELAATPLPFEPEAITRSRPRSPAMQSARRQLPRPHLLGLYESEGMSLNKIASRTDVSRQVVGRLLKEYGIPTIPSAERVKVTVDRDWLREQYIDRCRTLPDIAQELGMSTSNLARWARRHHVPLRPRGGGSHAANLTSDDGQLTPRQWVRIAVTNETTRERLELFRHAAGHPTIASAARQLHMAPAALRYRIKTLERASGHAFIIPAEHDRKMKVTPYGLSVLAALSHLAAAAAPLAQTPTSEVH
ncbi:TniQ family protein [Tsukamurella tyrosinosolvens]|nr:TniQ family protein [Tsukamurella tyrosinosolvens]